MASVAEKIGELNGTVRALCERHDTGITENNRRWEEHQRLMDDRFREQGKRTGDLEDEIKKVANDLIQHQLRCHKNGAGSGYDTWKGHAKTVAPYAGTAGGGVIIWEFVKQIFSHLK